MSRLPLLVLAFLALLCAPAGALTLDTATDEDDGACAPGGLREAVRYAPSDTIIELGGTPRSR